MGCKIVDFGNACWTDRQFSDNIQTRQYRAPEVWPLLQYLKHIPECDRSALQTGTTSLWPQTGVVVC
jgi:serine/threonine protein kinase